MKKSAPGGITWDALESIRSDDGQSQIERKQALVRYLDRKHPGKGALKAERMFNGPQADHIEGLRSDPEARSGAFDRIYGNGAAEAVLKRGAVSDTALGVGRGIVNSFVETGQFAVDGLDGLENLVQEYVTKPAAGLLTGNDLSDYDVPDGAFVQAGRNLTDESLQEAIPETDTIAGGAAEGISQFLTGYISTGPLKAAKGAHAVVRYMNPMLRGAGVDFVAFDPDDPQFLDLLDTLGVPASEVVPWLHKAETDSDLEKRAKAAIEGAGMGVAADVLFYGLKKLRGVLKSGEEKTLENAMSQTTSEVGEAIDRIKNDPEVTNSELADILQVDPSEMPGAVSDKLDDILGKLEGKPAKNIETPDSSLQGLTGRVVDESDPSPYLGKYAGTADRLKDSAKAMSGRVLAALSTEKPGEAFKTIIEDGLSANGWLEFQMSVRSVRQATFENLALKKEALQRVQANAAELPPRVLRQAEDAFDEMQANYLVLSTLDKDVGSFAGTLLQNRQIKPNHIDPGKVDEALKTDPAAFEDIFKVDKANAQSFEKLKSKLSGDPAWEILEKLRELRKLGVPIEKADGYLDDFIKSLPEDQAKQAHEDKEGALLNIFNAANEYRINWGLLSAPTTAEINLISAMVQTVLNPLLEGGGHLMKGELRKARIRAISQYVGQMKMIRSAAHWAYESMKVDRALFSSGSRYEELFSSFTSDKLLPEGARKVKPLADAVDNTGHVVRSVGKLLLGTDEFFKRINYAGEVYASSVEEALLANLKGDAMKAHIAKRLKNSVTENTVDEAGKKVLGGKATDSIAEFTANERLFVRDGNTNSKYATDRVIGWGQKGLNDRGWAGGLSRMLLATFWRTPMRIFEHGFLRMTPVMNLASGRFRDDLMGKNGSLNAALARAQGVASISAVTYAYNLADAGLMTGDIPRNRKEREIWKAQGKRANSIYIDGEWHDLAKFQPFTSPFIITANAIQARNNLLLEGHHRYVRETEVIKQTLSGAAFGLMAAVESAPFGQAIENLGKLATGVADSDEGASEATEKFAANLIGSFVPNVYKRPAASFLTDVKRESYGPGIESSFYGELNRQIAPWSNSVFYDLLGRSHGNSASTWNLFKGQPDRNNEVLKTLEGISKMSGVYLGPPMPQFKGQDLRHLTTKDGTETVDEKMRRLASGDGFKYVKMKKSLEVMLQDLFSKSSFQELSVGYEGHRGGKVHAVQEVLKAYHGAILAELILSEPVVEAVSEQHEYKAAMAYQIGQKNVLVDLLNYGK